MSNVKENQNWPDEVRLIMIEKSSFYDNPTVYQYGYYDGYQLGIAGRSAGLERIAELEKELRKYLAYEPERDSKFHLTVLKRDTNNLLK